MNTENDMKKSTQLIIDAIIAVALIAFDQLTKYLAIANLKAKASFVIIKDVFELTYLENRGSAFGMLQNQKVFILFVGVVFMAVVVFFIIRVPARKRYIAINILLSMIFAGGIGNMIDRVRYDYVVDFFSFVLINFPIFNVADCYIVVATITLFILFIFVYKENDLEFLNFKQNKYKEIK